MKGIAGRVAYSNIGGLAIVNGTNLTGDLKVTVGGTPAKILGKYGTNRLVVLLPAKPTGTYRWWSRTPTAPASRPLARR